MRYLKHFKYYACRVLDRAHVLEHVSFELTSKIAETEFRIPITNGIGYLNLSHGAEPWMTTLLQRLLRRGGAVIDVGVNVGQTLLKIAAIDRDVAYYGFEPNPVCYAYSRALVDANYLASFKIFPVGLSATPGVVQLFGDNAVASGASIVEDFRIDKSRFKPIHMVPVLTADAVLRDEGIEAINFIKIDVEGAELDVVRGAVATIRRHRPVLIVEILPVYSLDKPNGRMRKTRQDELLALLRELDYATFLIHERTVEFERIADIPVHGDMGRTNYLFVPAAEASSFG